MQLNSQAPIEQSSLEPVVLPDPTPGSGEVRIQVDVCGVCRTDLHIVEGDLKLPHLPIIPGHQIVGTIDSIGPGVSDEHIGKRVGVGWLAASCGACEYCRHHQENLCLKPTLTGHDIPGGYAEFVIVPEEAFYPLGENVNAADFAPLLCAGIIGYRALKLAGYERGKRLGLYGFGGSAHIALQIAKHAGCDVIVATRSEDHRKQAAALGADWTGDAEDVPIHSLDAAVLFAPSGKLVPIILPALKRAGILAIAGIHLSDIPQLAYEHLYGERMIRSVMNNTRQDARELLQFAAHVPIKTEVERFPLTEANEALRRMKNSTLKAPAAVLIIAREQK